MEKINFQIEWFFKPEDDNDGIDAVATTATAAASSAAASAAAFAADTAAAANNDDNKDNNDDRDDMDDKKDGDNDKNNGGDDENKEDLRYDTNHLLLYFIKQIKFDIHIIFMVHWRTFPFYPIQSVCVLFNLL